VRELALEGRICPLEDEDVASPSAWPRARAGFWRNSSFFFWEESPHAASRMSECSCRRHCPMNTPWHPFLFSLLEGIQQCLGGSLNPFFFSLCFNKPYPLRLPALCFLGMAPPPCEFFTLSFLLRKCLPGRVVPEKSREQISEDASLLSYPRAPPTNSKRQSPSGPH